MIGAISGVSTYLPSYAAQKAQRTANIWTGQRSAPETAVEPVEPVRPSTQVSQNQNRVFNQQLPTIREGADPVEMAVRMRIQYVQPGEEAAAAENSVKLPGSSAEEAAAGTLKLPGTAQQADEEAPLETDAALGAADVQKAAEEGRCETCEKRKYQDGSDDPGVSFKTPTHIAPEQAASAVRGHESEHVVREQAEAQREGRKVVSQSVTYHTDICPECGKVYVSGGTTRTVTAADNQDTELQQKTAQQNQTRTPFSAVA